MPDDVPTETAPPRRAAPAPAPAPIARTAAPAPVSDSLADKLHQLEERLAVEPAPVTVVVPEPTAMPALPKKPAAKKRAPAKKAAASPTPAPEAPAPAAKKAAPVRKTPATTKAAAVTEVIAAPQPAPVEAVVAPVPEQRQPFGTGLRAAVVATVVLLAAAAGMAAAAVVENGPSTWESSAVVQVLPGSQSSLNDQDATAGGVRAYAKKVATPEFMKSAAGLKAGEKISGSSAGQDLLRLSARASTADAADALADAAATTMVTTVASNELATVSTPGDRLGAALIGRSSRATQIKPEDSRAYLAGGLAAGVVVVLALVLLGLRRRKSSAI